VAGKNYFLYASCHTLRLEQPPAAPPEAQADLSVYIEIQEQPGRAGTGAKGTAERMPPGVKNLIFIYR